jgi:hypothetical protein
VSMTWRLALQILGIIGLMLYVAPVFIPTKTWNRWWDEDKRRRKGPGS